MHADSRPTSDREVSVPNPSDREDARARVEQLGDAIAELSARIQAATYELLVLIREFDERAGWNEGFLSCAHWLSWRVGLDLGAAREKVRVARALATLPLISAAMRRGEMSYSKVRALTRIATTANEKQLLGAAQSGTAAHVERLVRAWRRVDRQTEARETARKHAQRYVKTWVDEDGMLVLRGRLTPELGAVVQRALEAAAGRLFREAARAPDEDDAPETTAEQRRADALALVAESALAGDLDRGTAGDRYQVVIHVDEETLKADGSPVNGSHALPGAPADVAEANAAVAVTGRRAGVSAETPRRLDAHATASGVSVPNSGADTSAETPEPAEEGPGPARRQAVLEDGVRISAETARRMACDASLVVMRHAPDGSTLDVGRKRRTIPPAIRRALAARDRTCQFTGCTARHCEAHHLVPWSDGGATRLSNLTQLCKRHHRAVHEEGFTLTRDADGVIRVYRPDGRLLPESPPAPGWQTDADRMGDPLAAVDARLAAEGIHIGPQTATPHWDGHPLDLAWTIDVLCMPRVDVA